MHKIIKDLCDNYQINCEDLREFQSVEFISALNNSKILKLKNGVQFITSGETVNGVYILLSGVVRAMQEFTSGEVFSFRAFEAQEFFGEMEILANIDKFRASLITDTDCVFLLIPKLEYIKFLKKDADFLYLRTSLIINRELEEHAHLRTFLMIKAIDRIKIYLISSFDHECLYEDVCILKITRKKMMEETGYSIRTISRSLKILQDESLIVLDGQKIMITRGQYLKMRKSVDSIISY